MIEFHADISDFGELQRQIIEGMRYLAGESGGAESALFNVLAEGAQYAAEVAPFLTGTLSSSVTPMMETVTASRLEGRITLAHIENPVFGEYADVYGPVVHDEGAFGGVGTPRPFMAEAAEYIEGALVPKFADDLQRGFLVIFR